MKKYLWIILFFVTTLCFAQSNAAINQASIDNNLVIQLVDSKLVNLDNKIAVVVQSNQDGIADLKARTDEKLADKFKQFDDRNNQIDRWLSVLGLLLTFFGIMTPLGAFLLNRKIDKNIKDSQELLDKEIKNAIDQVKNKLLESDRLLTEMNGFHRKAEISASEIQDLAKKASSGSLTPEDSQKLKNDSNALKNIPENELTASDWFIRGLNAQNQKDHYEAITYYNKVIQLNKKEDLNSPVYSNRGVAKFKLGLYHDAIKDYDLAIKLSDRNYQAYFNRALANKKLEDNELALKDYDKVIEIQPDYYDAYINLGIILVKLQRYDDALKNYDKAISLDPKDKNNYFDKACVYALMKNKNEALKWLENALQLDYLVKDVLKDEDWKIYLDDADFKSLIAKYNKQ